MKWKEIPYYQGKYSASTEGDIRNNKTGKYLTPFQLNPNDNHLVVSISYKGTSHSIGIHRLVALTYIPNPFVLTTVHHKDFDPTNNRPDNLQWVSSQTNTALGNGNHNNYVIHVYNRHGMLVNSYETKVSFLKSLNMSPYTKWTFVTNYMSMDDSNRFCISEVSYNWLKRNGEKSYASLNTLSKFKGNKIGGQKGGKHSPTKVWLATLNSSEIEQIKQDSANLSHRQFKDKYKHDIRSVLKALDK